MGNDSPLVFFGIPSLALLVVGLLIWGTATVERASLPAVRRRRVLTIAAGTGLWMALLAVAAAGGVLGRFDQRPPPMMPVMLSVFGLALWLGLSSQGRRLAMGLPLAVLVGVHAFRLPLELVMHHAARVGIMPSVMSYSGYNFDIVSGTTAALLGGTLAFGRFRPRLVLALVAIWNVLGLGLLFVVAGIALAATPIFRAFGEDQLNIWVSRFPYVWIVVLVSAALLGHVLIFRRLFHEWRTGVRVSS